MAAGPDSGYSWVVVGCCSFIHFALFGIFRSAGVMFVAMIHNYNVTREEASWPFSLASGVFQLTGPVGSLIAHYTSQRRACILGSAIATFGIAGCYFAESVAWINGFYGIIHGFGFGILTTLLTVILNQYFLKYRATAIGIAFAGGSISSLVFPLVMEWLLENYSLRDSFLLLSGITMNTLVAASLLRAPPWLKKPKENEMQTNLENTQIEIGPALDQPKYQIAPQVDHEHCDAEESENIRITSRESSNSINKFSDYSTGDSRRDDSSLEMNDTLRSNNDSVLFEESYPKLNTANKSSRNGSIKNGELEVREPLIYDKNSVIILPKREEKKETSQQPSFRHSVSSILRQTIFYKIALTMCIYFLGVHSTFMVIVDFAKDKGISEKEGAYIISMFSLTDLIGRAGLGWVTDRNFVRRKDMVCINLAILGVVYQLYPIVNAYPGILAIAAVQGLAVGCSITLFFVIQVESMGLRNLAVVVGMTSFINGISSFLRPGIIGFFRDVIGSYNWMFHIIGSLNLVCALVWLVESWKSKGTPAVCDAKA